MLTTVPPLFARHLNSPITGRICAAVDGPAKDFVVHVAEAGSPMSLRLVLSRRRRVRSIKGDPHEGVGASLQPGDRPMTEPAPTRMWPWTPVHRITTYPAQPG